MRALCLAQNVPSQVIDSFTFSNSQVSGVTGGNPLLEEETAESFTVGVTWQSQFTNPWLSRLSASIDYYDITIEQVVGTVGVADRTTAGAPQA